MRLISFSRAALLLIPMLLPLRTWAGPPCATDMTEEGRARASVIVRDAEAALADGKPTEAFGMYERAYCQNPDPALKHWLSQAALNQDHCDEAFKDALFWVQHGDPSDRSTSVRWLSTVQEQCVQVNIKSEPSGASIHVDNVLEELGVTPWEGRLRSGAHVITVSRQGFSDAHRKLTLPVGPVLKPIEVRLAMHLASTEAANDLPFDATPAPAPPPPPSSADKTTVVIDTSPGGSATAQQSPPPVEKPTSVVIDTGPAQTAPPAEKPTSVVIDTGPAKSTSSAPPPPAAEKPTEVVIETGSPKSSLQTGPTPAPAAATKNPPAPAPVSATNNPPRQAAPSPQPKPAEARASPPPAPPPAPKPAVASPPSAPAPLPVVEAPKKPKPPSPKWVAPVAWGAIGVGAAALLVATVLGVVAHNNTAALRTSVEPGPSIQSQVNAINATNNGANALFGVGGALAAAGAGIRIAF
jgi:hypothetical protein